MLTKQNRNTYSRVGQSYATNTIMEVASTGDSLNDSSIMLDGFHSNLTTLRLTRREIEILALLAEGLTTSKIAEKLYISKHTVDSHRSNLKSKLKAKNTAKVISLGFRYGFLS